MNEVGSLDELLAEVDEGLKGALPPVTAWPVTIHEAVRYSLFAGGKRIRPLLVLAACGAVSGERAEAMPLALAVEMIHTYSLIHDDLPAMDNDDLRRGKPTSHKVFGEAVAILAGDALLTRAFHLLAEVPEGFDRVKLERRLRTTALLGQACGTTGLIGGQVEDLAFEGRPIEGPALERLHRAKTGALLSACVRGGGILGGAGARESHALEVYGESLGLAFQIVDDILDATGSAEDLGKTAGKDLSAGKATYVSVWGISRAREMSSDLRAKALGALEVFEERGLLLRELAGWIVSRHA
jgi:geranylgeranyl diphosphate synthase type II